MAGWTKAQYDAAYSFRVERYMPTRAPAGNVPGIHRPEVRINYHEYSMRDIMVSRWTGVLPLLTPSIGPSDRVIVIGAGFGWGVRGLRQQIGCDAIGTDVSPYIQVIKDTDDTAEIRDKIAFVGLDPTSGYGLDILNFARTPGNRAKELVLDEDLSTVQSRQNVATALGGNPTFICWEDLVDDSMTDQDVLDLVALVAASAARKFFIYTPTVSRSAQDLATLSGHRVITTDFQSVAP